MHTPRLTPPACVHHHSTQSAVECLRLWYRVLRCMDDGLKDTCGHTRTCTLHSEIVDYRPLTNRLGTPRPQAGPSSSALSSRPDGDTLRLDRLSLPNLNPTLRGAASRRAALTAASGIHTTNITTLMYLRESGCGVVLGRPEISPLESRHLESRAKPAARLVIEVSAGWARPQRDVRLCGRRHGGGIQRPRHRRTRRLRTLVHCSTIQYGSLRRGTQ